MHKIISLVLIVMVSSSCQESMEPGLTTEAQPKFVLPYFKTNWFKAAEYCNYLGLRLAVIDTQEKEAKLWEAIEAADIYTKKGVRIWIGGSDLAVNGHFHWQAIGKQVEYSNWGNNEPNNQGSSEHCIEVACDDGKWWCNDVDCKVQKYFACEKNQ